MTYPDPDLDVTTDPALAKLLRDELRRAAGAEDEDPLRADIARDILEGRTRASEVGQYSVGREALMATVDSIVQWREGLSESEYAEYERHASDYVEGVRRDLERDRSGDTVSESGESY